MKEAGIEPTPSRSLLDFFPPYRLMKNIRTINEFVGFDVSEHVFREHVVNVIKIDILMGLDSIHEVLDRLNVVESHMFRSALYTMDRNVYHFRNRFGHEVKGYNGRWKRRVPKPT